MANDGKSVKRRKFYLADTDAFVEPCCVIPDIGGPPNRYFMVHSRTKWPKMFSQWVDRPHSEDPISDEESEDEIEQVATKKRASKRKK